MKHIAILFLALLFMASCAETPDRPAPVMTQAQHDAINAESAAIEAQKAAQASAVASSSPSTLHYYCATHPNKGGDTQGSCPDCGQALVHNAAFHNTGASAVPTPGAASPAVASSSPSTLHYYCSTHPTQGGESQGSCPECGQALVHNAAFHNNDAATSSTTGITPPATAEPAVNAAGVYHYTCSNGCAGGAGSQTNCATCGSPLVHNAAYHN